MQECMDIASQVLPELVEEASAPAKIQQSNLSIMLSLAKKMQNTRSSRFKSPGLVSESVIRKMGSLKGYAPHPDANGAEPPLKSVSGLLKPTTRKWKDGLQPAGLQEHPLPNNIPGRFKTGTSTTAGNMQLVETLALELASATEIQFDLLRRPVPTPVSPQAACCQLW